MEVLLLLTTADGIVVCRRAGQDWKEAGRGLPGQPLTSVIAREGVILVGAAPGRDGPGGVYRSDDLGETWQPASQGLELRHVRWLAYHPEISDFEFAGTEPAGIFISRDGAQTWRACPEVAEMRQKYGWRLPYSPEAGCVRGFAMQGKRAYAAVEDGCVLVSDDSGQTWRLAEGSRGYPEHAPAAGRVHSDVHSVASHPSSPNLVVAPTGGGFYLSQDGGRNWERRYPNCYCRAVWVDPRGWQHMILGPAEGVDRGGRIEETRDGGQSWQMASAGLEAPWRNFMVERFFHIPAAVLGDGRGAGELLAVLSNGSLAAAALPGEESPLSWRPVLTHLEHISGAATLEA